MGSDQKWVEVNWLKALVATLGVTLCVALFLLLAEIKDPPSFVIFIQAALPSAVVVLIAYLLGSYLLFRKGVSSFQQLREEIVEAVVASSQPVRGLVAVYTDFGAPPWDALWSESREVVLVARFFDGIVRENVPSLERFWQNKNATVEAVIPDPRSRAALQSLDHQRDGNIVRDDPLGRILRGLWVIEQARASQAASASAFEIYLAEDPLSYAAYCFDNEHLLLKAYEYQLEPADRFPRSHFLLSDNDPLSRFWHAEAADWFHHPPCTYASAKQLIEEARRPGEGEASLVGA
ncbi:MAG TPA: hypothetical protein VG448_13305 [Solirubrobacterales bacterium]|nr:hypothetical protein [Solirubrobacterales bacterium]